MRLAFLMIFALLHSCSSVKKSEQSNRYDPLNSYIDKVVAHQRGAGSIVLLKGSEIVYKRHFSFNDIPQTPLYRIGSITKTYTATIALKLVEEGKLRLEDKLSKFYPEMLHADQISIEHLLRHRSGLQNFTDLPEYLSYHEKSQTVRDHLKRFKKLKLDFPPGSKYSYSNTGYVLLTLIAERTSNKSFQQLLKDYITGPLNLKHTYVYTKKKPRPEEVSSYVKSTKWRNDSNTDESVPLGAGAIVASAEDVGLFLFHLINGNLVSEPSKKMMLDLKDGYGLGIISFPYNKRIAYGHTGGIDGFRSIAGHIPEENLTMVQMMNAVDLSFNDLSIAILASHFGDPVKQPDFKEQKLIDPKILANYVGTFSDKNFPLKIKIIIKDGHLLGQGTGQPSFVLSPISNDEFEFKQASLKLKFLENGKVLELTQGKKFILRKE